MSVESLKDTIVPKSDQLNADDLLVGPITVQVLAVTRGNAEQPISVAINGYQPFKPCKSMRRVMIAAWGDNGAEWVGKWMTLFCDPSVKYGGVQVGGIRISHMSGLDSDISLMLTTTRSKRSEYRVKKLTPPVSLLDALREAAMVGSESLKAAFGEIPNSATKSELWKQHGESLKKAAEKADQNKLTRQENG